MERQEQNRIFQEYIVLIPFYKSSNVNIVSIERQYNININDENILHHGTGSNIDFIIYKNALSGKQENEVIDYSTQFKVLMTDKQTNNIYQENRIIHFWFNNLAQNQYPKETNDFLKKLFQSNQFPRDYLSFIKRLMELVRTFSNIRKIKLQIETIEEPIYQNNPQQYNEMIKENLLDILEQAFPNPMFVDDLSKYLECDNELIYKNLVQLEEKNLVKHLDNDSQQWTRVIISIQEENTHKIIAYKNASELITKYHPTIAIITVNYFEKLAVDAMIENKTTYIRYKIGESNVYTIGTIGQHYVVSTKLPLIGRTRTAQISTGSTTTRLLGTFQQIQHVFIIGCAGGIPHYTDPNKHIRRGDIIVGYPNQEDYIYGIYEAEESGEGYEFVSTCYKPKSFKLYQLLEPIKENYQQTYLTRLSTHKYPWETFLSEGIEYLTSHNIDCHPPSTDHLYIKNENNEIIEIDHPNKDKKDYTKPIIHFGMIAGGKNLLTNDYLKLILKEQCHVLCFDTEIDQVLAAIQGNRIESFMIIRGISDYQDGSLNKEWQPYSSLCAASFMKTIIYQIPI